MSWIQLKADIAAIIKANGVGAITGNVLQDVLNNLMVAGLGAAQFKGVATPSTMPTLTDGPSWYMAYLPGTYTNFDGYVSTGGVVLGFRWTGTAWLTPIVLADLTSFEWDLLMNGFQVKELAEGTDDDDAATFSQVKEYPVDFSMKGIIETGVAGEALVIGDVVYLKSDGKFWKASNAAAATAAPELRMASEDYGADETGVFLVVGLITLSGLTAGAPYYLGTGGAITATRPTAAGEYVRYIGTAKSTTVLFVHIGAANDLAGAGGGELTAVVDDLTPELGGTLNAGGFGIEDLLNGVNDQDAVTVFQLKNADIDLMSKRILDQGWAGEDLTKNEIVYLKDDGKYWKASNANQATSAGELRMVAADMATGDQGDFLICAKVPLFVGLTAGAAYYLGTGGGMTTTRPTTAGVTVRYIGTAITTTTLFVNIGAFNELLTSGGSDEKVKYDAGDTTAGYLADKVVAGANITLEEGTGADENKLKIIAAVGLSAVVDDTTPELGGDLDAGAFNINNLADAVDPQDAVTLSQAQGLDVDMDLRSVISQGVAGQQLKLGDIVYLKDDGKFWRASNAAQSTSAPELRMALGNMDEDDTGSFMMMGVVTLSALTAGAAYYLGTGGEMTATRPTASGVTVRYIGTALSSTVFLVNIAGFNHLLLGGGYGAEVASGLINVLLHSDGNLVLHTESGKERVNTSQGLKTSSSPYFRGLAILHPSDQAVVRIATVKNGAASLLELGSSRESSAAHQDGDVLGIFRICGTYEGSERVMSLYAVWHAEYKASIVLSQWTAAATENIKLKIWGVNDANFGKIKLYEQYFLPTVASGDDGKYLKYDHATTSMVLATPAGAADEKVKYDAGDSSAGYVADKFVAGTGISLAEGTGASENKLVITATGGGSATFAETTVSATPTQVDASDFYEFALDMGSGAFLIDAILVYSTSSGEDLDLNFNIEVFQKEAIDLTAAADHDLDWTFNLIYREDTILLHNTQLTATEPSGEDELAVDDNDKLSKYDLIIIAGAEYHRVKALTGTTGITIYDGLVAEQADGRDVMQVYERKNLGMCYNKDGDNNIYVRIENNDAVNNRNYRVVVKTTKIA
jgi:hypothetical protein